MPKRNYGVKLTEDEKRILKPITHNGSKSSAKTILHANILLQTNDNSAQKRNVREIVKIFDISPTTVNQVRKTYANQGLEAVLNRKTRLFPPHISKITGGFEAQVLAMALSHAPKGASRWTLRLLAEYSEERKYIVPISYVTIGNMLNTNQVKPHLNKYWCVPKENDAHFVLHMEDVLGVYKKNIILKYPSYVWTRNPFNSWMKWGNEFLQIHYGVVS